MAMTWKDAAVCILAQNKEGMHYTDISKAVILNSLIASYGATPAASLNSAISMDLKNNQDKSFFERIGPGIYRINSKVNIRNITNRIKKAIIFDLNDEEVNYGYINAYGMYWDRELIDWSKSPGALFGRQNGASTIVNFSEQDGVYLLYNNEKIIYVGKANSSSLYERLKSHTMDRLQQRWNKFSWFGIKAVDEKTGKLKDVVLQNNGNSDLISTLEALLIEAVEPNQNRQAGKGFAAIEFFQIADKGVIFDKAKKMLDKV
jgi:hypothetical protein